MDAEPKIRFEDGAGYERMMGTWSRLVGQVFLDWLAAPPGLRWVDMGCGNGAFSQLIADRCSPASLDGFDPSAGQLAYARERPAARIARFQEGDAMQAPFGDAQFDAAVMALVLFFVPEPSRAVAEMARILRPGGLAAAYTWDFDGGGFPAEPLLQAMRDCGIEPVRPPRIEASRLDVMQALWRDAGFVQLQTRQITVQREFAGFDELWETVLLGSTVAARIRTLPPEVVERIRGRMRERVGGGTAGAITCSARANAICGRKPAAA